MSVERREKCSRYCKCYLIPICYVALVCFLASVKTTWAGGQVRGEYIPSSPKIIQLRISIGTPSPSHIIVTQRIPAGVKVVSSQPKAQKIDSGSGEVKWLLKKPQAGSQILTLELAEPVQASMVSATFRYRNPVTSQFVESAVSP